MRMTDAQAVAEDAPAVLEVDRAAGELRRGLPVVLEGAPPEAPTVMLAVDGASEAAVQRLLRAVGGELGLAVTGRRAALLGLPELADAAAVVVRLPTGLGLPAVRALVDPLGPVRRTLDPDMARAAQPGETAAAAVALAKLARLLPAALLAVPADAGRAAGSWLRVAAADVLAAVAAGTVRLERVSEARVPLADAADTRVIAFRPADGGAEHLAIVIGEPDPAEPVLARIHSSCVTGDLLGSLRCDCGDQLRGAIAEIARAGSGVVLYLNQEGRGIGIANKLRAYRLQDRGFDTVDANHQLGFESDERDYAVAAALLRELGIGRVRLMTNNPAKLDALAQHGIAVVERVRHAFPANAHNRDYLAAKVARSGHLI